MADDTLLVQPLPTGGEPIPRRRFLVLVAATSLGLTATLSRGVWRSYRGPDLAAARLAERRRYYEVVLRGADLSFSEADFWEEVPD